MEQSLDLVPLCEVWILIHLSGKTLVSNSTSICHLHDCFLFTQLVKKDDSALRKQGLLPYVCYIVI